MTIRQDWRDRIKSCSDCKINFVLSPPSELCFFDKGLWEIHALCPECYKIRILEHIKSLQEKLVNIENIGFDKFGLSTEKSTRKVKP